MCVFPFAAEVLCWLVLFRRVVAPQDWDLVSTYPNAFRSLVPVFTKYTDAAFPGDDPVDTTSRVALRYDRGGGGGYLEYFRGHFYFCRVILTPDDDLRYRHFRGSIEA